MTTFSKTWTLSLLAAASIGCGGDAATPRVTDPTNADTNAATNSATNADPNNAATNGNPGTNNATTPTNNIDPPLMGEVVFGGSSDPTWYTNGTLTIQIAPGEGAEDIELILGDDEVLFAFGDATETTWDTTSLAEGAYALKLRYSLGGSVRWSDDVRTVIVDRTSPQLASSTPAPNSDAASDAPLTLTFDEPIEAASVSPATVKLELTSGQAPSYTTAVSSDGLTISVDFDHSAAPAPYSALISVDGVTDLAGNAASDGFSYAVPAWFDTSFAASLNDPHYFVVGTSQYVVGLAPGTPSDTVRVFEKTNRLGSSFQEVATATSGQVYDLDADVADGKIHVALLRNDNVGGIIVKTAQLLEFDPADNSLAQSGVKGVGVDSDNGAIALDMRELPNETRGSVAVVSNGTLSVFNFASGMLTDATPSTFPSGSYSFVRDEDLSVHVRQDSFSDVAFAKCTNGADPCYRTQYKHMGAHAVGGWTEYDLNFTTPLGSSSECDEYRNFSTLFDADILTMFGSYQRCTSTQSEVFAIASSATGAADVTSADIMASMPGLADTEYTTHVAGDAQNLHAALASRTQLMVGRVGASAITWLPDVAADLDTDEILLLKRVRFPRLYTNNNGKPVVVFRHGNNIHIRTAN